MPRIKTTLNKETSLLANKLWEGLPPSDRSIVDTLVRSLERRRRRQKRLKSIHQPYYVTVLFE